MKTQPEPNPPGENVPPLLGSFLSERRDFITKRWIEAVRRNDSLEAAKQADDVDLADHLPKLFDDLSATLRGEAVDKEAKRDAEAHGEHRWRQHYELEEVLEELGIVSRVLLAHGLDAFADAYPDTPKEQRRGARERILRFFEDAAAGSVREYVSRVKRQMGDLHEQMRETDLSLSEQRRLALDSAKLGWWNYDVASGEVSCDDRFRVLYDMDKAADVYALFLSRVHPEDQRLVDEGVKAALRAHNPAPYALDYRIRHRDGTVRWVASRGQAVFVGEGTERKAVRLAGTLGDITEEKEAAKALAAGAARGTYLVRLSDVLRPLSDPGEVQAEAARALGEHLGVNRVAYFEIEGGDYVVDQDYVNGVASLAGRHPVAAFGSLISDPLTAGQAVVEAATSATAGRSETERAVFASLSIGAVASVPLVKGGGFVAGLTAQTSGSKAWSAEDLWAIRETAERTWAAVERTRAERALQAKEATSRFLGDLGEATRQTTDPDAVLGVVVDALQRHLGVDRCAYVEVAEDQDTFTIRYDQADPAGSNRSLAGRYRWMGFGQQMLPLLQAGKTVAVADVVTDPRLAGGREAMAAVGVGALVNVPLVKAGRLVAALAVNEVRPRRWTAEEIALIEAVAERSWGEVERSRDARALAESEARFRRLADSERAARTEAERTSQMKDEFLATLSHELRTPLNAILGWTQVLRGDPANTEDMEAGLATIERNSRAQTQIIEDLLDMSKIISGKVRLDVQPLQLDQVVASSVETMRPAATAKHIRLQVVIDPQARMISGDPNRLQQVFWNLLSNAIKFTPKEGKVQVVLQRVHSHLEVSIADTGEGIAPEFLPYVFDRFRQQDASTTRKHGGLGLGLAIVKQLVELHGGTIHVDSPGRGQGTTFRVMLPLSVAVPAPAPDDAGQRHPQSGGVNLPIPADRLNLAGVKVLVVDDEADARALVQRLLEDRGAKVQAAGSVAEAMRLLVSHRPDVLVSDIGMPEEDGYALIRQVRALPAEQGGSTPAVALTAYARSEDRLKVILAGFQMHMAKPVEAAELLALVASLTGRVAGIEKSAN